MRSPALVLASLSFVSLSWMLTGCGAGPASSSHNNTTDDGTQTSASVATPGMMVDAAVEGILRAGTETSAAGTLATRSVPRVTGSGATSVVVQNLTTPLGLALFPNATGTLAVSWTGAAITSWPTTLSQVVDATVTVTTHDLTYTDATAGLTVVVDGTCTFTLSGSLAGTSALTWQSDLVSTLTIPTASPLQTTITQGGSSSTVRVTGQRKVRTLTHNNGNPLGATVRERLGTRTWTRTVSGTATSPLGGDEPVTTGFTTFVATKELSSLGTVVATWTRAAQSTGVCSFPNGTVTITRGTTTPSGSPSVYDRTFLSVTVNGVTTITVGPKTGKDMATTIAAAAASTDF